MQVDIHYIILFMFLFRGYRWCIVSVGNIQRLRNHGLTAQRIVLLVLISLKEIAAKPKDFYGLIQPQKVEEHAILVSSAGLSGGESHRQGKGG